MTFSIMTFIITTLNKLSIKTLSLMKLNT
jgi:hypothetical protein